MANQKITEEREIAMATTDVRAERRSQSHGAIHQLVNHRTEMLRLYSLLAAHRPFEATAEMTELLTKFCQSLVDYSADAHFRLYRFIDANSERRAAVLETARRVYPVIASSTDAILDFNDKYDTEDHCRELVDLEKDLSTVGEALADRIELEDQLVEALVHSRK